MANATSVYPSFGNLKTSWMAITPPAPGRFSITTGCFKSSCSRLAITLVSVSAGVPVEKGIRILIVLFGKFCAVAIEAMKKMLAVIKTFAMREKKIVKSSWFY